MTPPARTLDMNRLSSTPAPAGARATIASFACALCAAALGVAFAPAPAAAQQVEVYGVLDAFVGTIRRSDAGGTSDSRAVVDSGGLQTSFFGISGSEDLGFGLKAVFALEAFLRNDTGAAGRFDGDAFFARSAFVGFEGEFGRTTVGRNTTPYFESAIGFNPFVDSFVVGPAVTHIFRGALEGDTAMNNSIRLRTRERGGWRADLLWSAGDERGVEPDRKRGRALDAAVFYGPGPLEASLAYRSIDLSGTIAPADGRDQKAWLLGAAYDFEVAKLFAQYQDIADSGAGAATEVDTQTWQIGASVPVGAGSVLLSWANSKFDDAVATAPDKRDTWAVGYDHNLSKRTDLYAVYYRDALKDPTGQEEQVVALGIRHRF